MDLKILEKTASFIPGYTGWPPMNVLHFLSNRIKADKHFDANKVEWKLQLAMQHLPEKQRVVFTLRYYDEMPYEEMSRVLETSEGALKASYHHAVKKIEDYMINH